MILVPPPAITLAPPAVEGGSLNHWTAREVPTSTFHIFGENSNMQLCWRTIDTVTLVFQNVVCGPAAWASSGGSLENAASQAYFRATEW